MGATCDHVFGPFGNEEAVVKQDTASVPLSSSAVIHGAGPNTWVVKHGPAGHAFLPADNFKLLFLKES